MFVIRAVDVQIKGQKFSQSALKSIYNKVKC